MKSKSITESALARRRPTRVINADVDLDLYQRADGIRIKLSQKTGKKMTWVDILNAMLEKFVEENP